MTEVTKNEAEVSTEETAKANLKTITINRDLAILTLNATNADINTLNKMEQEFLAAERTEINKAAIAIISNEIVRKIHIQAAMQVLAKEGKLNDFVKDIDDTIIRLAKNAESSTSTKEETAS